MSVDVSKYLGNPRPGITLDELAKELNQLAKIRDDARVAFCKRLAIAYLMIVGHRPNGSSDSAPFFKWCADKLRSANGKQYTRSTLGSYVSVGFSKNPVRVIAEQRRNDYRAKNLNHSIGVAIKQAVATDSPPKVIPITRLKKQGMPSDVAKEVNQLMTAWEQASSQARAQFMYIVTGKRIAA